MLLTILEGTLAQLGGLLLELLNGTLVDTTALVDQVASGGRLAGIDVADNCAETMNIAPIAHDQRPNRHLPTTLTWSLSFPIFGACDATC